MEKRSKKTTKEWLELTLCNLLDEIIYLLRNGESKDKIMGIIKKYSAEVYNSQDHGRK